MDPFKQLVSMLDVRMDRKTSGSLSGLPCELGTMSATGIKLDSFQHEIQDFYAADWLAKLHLPSFALKGTVSGLKDSLGGAVTGTCLYQFEEAAVEEVRINLKAGLRPGDRVLAVPVAGGREVVVIGRVVNARA